MGGNLDDKVIRGLGGKIGAALELLGCRDEPLQGEILA